MSLIESILIAMFLPHRSRELLLNSKGKTFVCMLLTLFIAFSMIYAVPVIRLYHSFFDTVQNKIPPFFISSFGISIPEPYALENEYFYLELNNTTTYEEEDILQWSDHPFVLICDDAYIHFLAFGKLMHIPYFELQVTTFSLQQFVGIKSAVRTMGLIVLLCMFVMFFLLSFFSALLFSIAGLVLSWLFHAELRYGEIYHFCLYALFLPLMAQGIMTVIPHPVVNLWAHLVPFPLTILLLGCYIFHSRKTSTDFPEDDDNTPKIIRI